MNCIAIETSTTICSVALFKDNNLIKIKEINIPRSHSKELGVMIKNLLNQSNVEINILDFIALSSGPGSFTGLRIGSSLAKGIAYTLKIPIVMVPTLYSLASKIKIIETHSIGLFSHKDQIYIQDFKNCLPCSDIKIISVKQINNEKLYGFGLNQADTSIDFFEIQPSAMLVGKLAFENYNEWLVEDLTKAKLNYVTNLNIN